MSEPSLEALFERYRSAGDLAAMAAIFDRTAPELLALAAHLVRDPLEGEDLVQSTFLAAIEGARAFDPSRRLAPWLAGILVRQALRAQRERARRADPARFERPPIAAPPALLEQRELAAALRGALDDLAEPYRSVLERHLRGERALDIARSSGRAPGTVRMQILRGLERLRRALPAGHFALAPGRIPRGLEAVRAEVLNQSGAAPGASSAFPGASAAAVPSVLGGLAMSTKVVVSAVAAAALLLLVLVRSSREPATARPLVARDTAEPTLARERAPEVLRDVPISPERAPAVLDEHAGTPEQPPERASVPAEDERAGVFVTGELLGLDGLDPAEVEIAITTPRSEGAGGSGSRRSGDGSSSYAVEITELLRSPSGAPTAVYVTAVHSPGRKSSVEFPVPDAARIAARETPARRTDLVLDLDLSLRTTIVGRVRACEGISPPTIQVGLVRDGELVASVECDDEGAFTLYPRSAGDFVLFACVKQVPPVTRSVRVGAREIVDAGVLVLEPGGLSIEGTVRVPFKARPDQWRVRAQRVVRGSRTTFFLNNLVQWNPIEGQLGSPELVGGNVQPAIDGSFRITGLAPGRYELLLEQSSGPEILVPGPAVTVVAPATNVVLGERHGRTFVSVASPAEGRLSAQLEVGFEHHRVRHSPLARGETVEVISDSREPLELTAEAPGFQSARSELPAFTRALDGRVELVLLPDASLTSLELEWTLAEGLATPDWLTLYWTRDGDEGETVARAEKGRCRFEGWKPGRYRIVLVPGGEGFWELSTSSLCAPALDVELVAGSTTHAFVDWIVGGGARFAPEAPAERRDEFPEAEVRDASGVALDVRFHQREYDDGTIMVGTYAGSMPLHGQCELLPKLPPGSYELVLTIDDEPLRVPFAIVAGETVDVPFVVP